jgi:hypothetical protein
VQAHEKKREKLLFLSNMRDLYDWRDIFTYANGKKKRRKGRRENQVMHISLHI